MADVLWDKTGRRAMLCVVVVATCGAGFLSCAVPPSGEPEASPTSLAFGSTTVGTSTSENVVITNVAPSDPLTVESMGIAGPDAASFADQFDDEASVVLAAGESVTVPVTFAPTAAGVHEATVRVNHSGAADFSVPLSGTGVDPDVGPAPLVATPTTASFPSTAVGQTASQDVELRNGAVSGSLVVTATTVAGPDATQFADSFADGDPVALGPGDVVTVTVTFSPSASGPRSATLHVAHDGTNTPLAIPLSGHAAPAGSSTVLYRVNAGGPALPGAAGAPAWSEDSAAFPSPHVNAAATGNRVSSSTAPIDVSDPSLPAGTPAAIFQSERWDFPAAPNLAYAFAVPSGFPVEVRLYFAETAEQAQVVGGRVFDVRIDGAVSHRDVDAFARVGANKGLMLAAPVISDGVVDIALVPGMQSPAVKAIEILTAGSEIPPWLAAAPSLVDFSPATVRQSSTQHVTITNVGTTGALTLSSTEIAGQDAKMFADRFDDTVPVALPPGGSTTVPVVLLPTTAGSLTASLVVTHSGPGSPTAIPLTGTASPPENGNDPPFVRSLLAGAGVTSPTSLQFGPDGRLYVAQMDGTIKALTIARTGAQQYTVTASETITLIRSLPNRNDNGALNTSVTGRLVTGLLVTGTAQSPQIYAVSTDPRIGAGTSGADLNLDTNSGILSRLTRQGSSWQKVDLVRGLPRSEENHAGNGLALDTATNTLLIAYGGHTNMGAPSHNFAFLPEFALSAAVLSVDLDAIGNTTHNLPTLDDENRAGSNDANDPFGGNDGKNQARLVPGGPVQVFAAGFRNPFDLVLTRSGQLYTIDNGGNAGWGGHPRPDDTLGECGNDPAEGASTDRDSLIRIPGAGFYGGHPNPTRANVGNTFNPSNPQSPVTSADPVQCDYRTEAERGALASFPYSTNGIVEYTATTFDGAMTGDLVAASLDSAIYRIRLSADGTAVTSTSVLFSAGQAPLDVTTRGDGDPFPGTIWVADFTGDSIVVFEPDELVCSGADDPSLDEDGDGFDNADEIDNSTNPCSQADVPPDADGDHTSDRNDPDDDNDGLADTSDPFAVDAANGRGTPLPIVLTWDNDAPPAGGLLDLGFTGLMGNGIDYAQLFDASRMTAGGAAGVVTIDEVGDGDALGTLNAQEYGFQLGVDASPASGSFVVRTRLPAPFIGTAPVGGEAFGIFVGTGDQDNYVKLAVAANGGAGGFQLVNEQAGVATTLTVAGPPWPSAAAVDLFLHVDPAAGTVVASYSIDGAAPVVVGPTMSVPAGWFDQAIAPAVGIISTSTGPAAPFPATWDFLEVQPAA